MVTPAERAPGTATERRSPSSELVALSLGSVVDMPFSAGEMIAGKYEVQALIGAGGMGYVVSALHVELGEKVALKFLRPEALAIPELVERFAREARAAAKIKSEHIARVFDVGALPDGVPFIVMEHLEGQDLGAVLHEQGPIPIKVAIEYVMQACEALAAAHAAGVVHRDVKPENLFLTRHAQGLDFIKILDFGISKVALAQGKRAHVRTQMPLGSPTYMSPEQIRSSEQVDARTDIWSLGCVLFELLTGLSAFEEPTLMQLSAAILEHEPVPLRSLLPDAPVELEKVISRCLEKDANQRYGNIAELAIALYPFAPRRSRISAERCYHALKNAGIPCPEFEIGSEYPPGMSDQPSFTNTQRASGVIPLANHNVTPALLSELGHSAAVTFTSEELEQLRPTKRYKQLAWAALVLAVCAGAYLLTQGGPSDPPAQSGASPTVATAAVTRAATPPPRISSSATQKAGLAAAAPEVTFAIPPAKERTASPRAITPSTKPSARALPHHAPAAPKSPSGTRSGASPSDEPDVGY